MRRLFFRSRYVFTRNQLSLLLLSICLGNFWISLSWAEQADLLVVKKAERSLSLYAKGKEIRRYRVALGGAPLGPKRCQGDGKTPEGDYSISGRNPKSQFHRSLRVSYPNEKDKELSRIQGCPPGGDIMIHGLPNGRGWLGATHTNFDWTNGCVALSDQEIQEVWRLVPDGTKVKILP